MSVNNEKPGKNVKDVFGGAVNDVVNAAKNFTKKMDEDSKRKEVDKKVMEHEYNIGRYVYDNDLEINDAKIISNINAIDRLVEEINELEGKNNG